LTTEGLIQAVELKNKLLPLKIKIINNKNQQIECKVSEVSKKINQKVSILDVVSNLTSENIFNFVEFKRHQESR